MFVGIGRVPTKEMPIRVARRPRASQRQAEGQAAAATMSKNRWMLETLAGPALANRPITQITSVEILAILQQVERNGRRETARRMRSAIGRVFRFAIASGNDACGAIPAQMVLLTVSRSSERLLSGG
jgi:hypothetical protein